MNVLIVLLLLAVGLLALVWYDGGREEPRQIVEPVTLPLGTAESGA